MRLEASHVVMLTLLALSCAPAASPVAVPAPTAPASIAPPPAPAPATQPVLAQSEAPPAVTPETPPTPTKAPSIPSPTPPATPPLPQRGESTLALDEMAAHGGVALKAVIATPERFRFQVLYSPVEGGALSRHGYRVDAEYFFPASSMKVPIALTSFAMLGALRTKTKTPALSRDSMLRVYPVSGGGEPVSTTLAREAAKALIVSDNFSANRLLAFTGHKEVHQTLWTFGLRSARVHSGFATGAELDPAELSPRVDVTLDGATRQLNGARKSTLVLPATDAKKLSVGEASIVDGRRVASPLSFGQKNAMKLRELQDTLIRVMRPDLLPKGTVSPSSEPASADDLAYMQKTLGTLPSASGLAGYDRNVVADYQLLPFLRGIERVLPRAKFQIFSKVGQAYGFLIHNAYVVERDTGRAFFLIAAIYANPNEVMNDDLYAYDTIAFPALADVGEVFARRAFAAR